MLFFYLFNIINIVSYSKDGPGSISFKLNPGRYRVFLYGAQGGSGYRVGYANPYVEGGRGSFINVTLNVQDWEMQFHAVVGGMGGTGQTGVNPGGANGGGRSGPTTEKKGSGGGGGATDLRVLENTTNNWIFVAAGGSGGVGMCPGAPGGAFLGTKRTSNTAYGSDTTISQTSGYAILNGGNGVATSGDYPGSGGGGGYYGGTGGVGQAFISSSYKAVGKGGSSYVFGGQSKLGEIIIQCKPTTFPNISWSTYSVKGNTTTGNGKFQLTEEFLCPENCTRCTSSTTCSECRNPYFTFNQSSNKCELSCPDKTFIDGFSCSSCPENCDSCESPSFCTICSSGAYMYNHFCYSDCSVLNQPDQKLYFGINDNSCRQCSDRNCIDCSEDSTICQNCEEGFLLQDKQCIFRDSNEFSHSNNFSNSMEFSQSDRFSYSNDFSHSLKFSNSNLFSTSEEFSNSNDFSDSLKFSNSNPFSTSEEFTNLIAFSNTKEETLAINNDNNPLAAGLDNNLSQGLPSSSVIIIVLSTLVAIAILVAIILFVRYKRKSKKDEKDTDIEMVSVVQTFTIAAASNLDVLTEIEKEESINSRDDPFNAAMIENENCI